MRNPHGWDDATAGSRMRRTAAYLRDAAHNAKLFGDDEFAAELFKGARRYLDAAKRRGS